MTTALVALLAFASPPEVAEEIGMMRSIGLSQLGAHKMLTDLCTNVGPRLSGSPGAAKAVEWTKAQMKQIGLQNIREVPCMVPHWVRGKVERASMPGRKLAVAALGGSIGTPKGGIEAEVVEVHSLQEVADLASVVKGRIVFYNRPFDTGYVNTFEAYGMAVNQRTSGAIEAAKYGAVGVLVRSMTHAQDDEPHTGAMRYGTSNKIPAAALGTQSAKALHEALMKSKPFKVKLELSCEILPDVPSASVIGDYVGTEKPNEIIVIGGHLDSWDLGQGAHDDGAGITQTLEAVRVMKQIAPRPKRTIRVVAFMNEENGLRGATAYAEFAKADPQVDYAAIESDSGGFMPRNFGVSKSKLERVQKWQPLLQQFGIERIVEGGGDADISPLEPLGTILFSLEPENQRYFDYHHSRNDTIDKVHPRELEFGAIAIASLAWLISQEGLD